MKKIANILLVSLSVLCFSACELDNYDAPDAGLEGVIYDHNGVLLETGQGTDNICIRTIEDSYAHGDSTVVVIPRNLNVKQGGTFSNNKLFEGTYTMFPYQGCFYPLTKEEYKTVELKSGKTTRVEFTVTPYLSLEWVQEPYQDTAGYIRAKFKFTRNMKDGVVMPDVRNARLFISTSVKCGGNSDGRYTDNDIVIGNINELDEIELRSKARIWYTQPLWIRIGAKCSDTHQKYCYTSIKSINAVGFGKP